MEAQMNQRVVVERPQVGERSRLTSRDLDLAYVLASHRAMRACHFDGVSASLGGRSELSERVHRARRQRQVGLGLIGVDRSFAGKGPVVFATPRAAHLVGFEGPVNMPTWSALPHTLALAGVGAYFIQRCTKWVPELLLPRSDDSWMGRDYRPDGVVTRPDGEWAVEVELSTKSLERTSRVIEERSRHFAGLAYFCGDERVAAHVKRASDQRGLWVQDFPVEIRLLREVVDHV